LHYHRAWYRRSRKLASYAALPGPAGDDVDTRHAARATVAQILDGMDEDQREVLVLAQVHGLSGPEIAEGLGIPLNTTYSRLRLARRYITESAANDEDLRRSEQPPRQAAHKAWALLLPKLAMGGAPAASAGPWAMLKLAATSTAIAGATLGLVAAVAPTRSSNADARQPAVVAESAREARPATRQSVPAPAEAPVVAQATPVVTPTVVAPRAGRAAPRTKPADRAAAAVDPVVAPPAEEVAVPVQRPVEAPQSEPAPTRLAEEARLVQQAQQALTDGDPKRALSVLATHRKTFPSGQLADAREGVWVRALCQAGRKDEARARAAKLARNRPGSAVTEAVRDVCAK
ncbi:MAG: sigma factor-like helix-turn-helix DNA-binding protein, partial [Myxococcota bacterium]